MVKLSIIIPVYNIADKIERCFNSVASQDIDASIVEIIFVNDGSTDNTLEVLHKLKYDNLKIITQENARQGEARNNGLRHASGEYVLFIDGDDALSENNSLKSILNLAESNNLDVLFYGIKKLSRDGTITDYKKYEPSTCNKVYNGIDYLNMRSLTMGPWYLFRRNFLITNNLFFVKNIRFEDAELMPRICFYAKRIMNAENSPYLYIENEDSTVSKNSLDRVLDLSIVFCSIYRFYSENKKTEAMSTLAYYSAMIFNSMLRRYIKLSKEEKQIFLKSATINKRDVLDALLNAKTKKYFFENIFLRFFWYFIFR